MAPFTHAFVKDCQLDTDMEILIPDDYVNSISERLNLYKNLDNIETEARLLEFGKDLRDRFGPVPGPVMHLINTIRLRWLSRALGFEKIILKNNRMKGYFISNQNSSFYQGEVFTFILNFIQQHPKVCKMKEDKNKLTLTFENINTTDDALVVLNRFLLPQPA